MKLPNGQHKGGWGLQGEGWRLLLLAGLCHVQQEEDREERGLFQYPVIMASCFHSLFNKPLSLSLSPTSPPFFHLPLSANPFKCNSILKAPLSCMSNECQGNAITMGLRRIQSAVCVQVI